MDVDQVQTQLFNEEHENATKRLTDLMKEYLAIKRVEREVQIVNQFDSTLNFSLQSILNELHPDVRNRINALKNIQVESIKLEADFHLAVHDLEHKFQMKYDDLFKKREKIVNGSHQPTEDECKRPGFEVQALPNIEPAEGQEKPSGIPNFWLTVFKNIQEFGSTIQPDDESVLSHLTDVRAFSKPSPNLSFYLEFHFEPNEFFKNSVLSKTYLMKCAPDADDPFSFEGPEIYRSIGCEIFWNAGKNVIEKSTTTDSTKPFFKGESFFNFFNPPEIEAESSENNDLIEVSEASHVCKQFVWQVLHSQTYLENDFEIGHYLKERVIPRAVLYYTNEIDEGLSDDESLNLVGGNFDGDADVESIEAGDN